MGFLGQRKDQCCEELGARRVHTVMWGCRGGASPSFSWESTLLQPAPQLSWAPHQGFRLRPGLGGSLGLPNEVGTEQACPYVKHAAWTQPKCPKHPLLLTALNSETGMLKSSEFYIAKIKDLQRVLSVKEPDSAAESAYELWITLYLMMLNCSCHLAAKSLTVFISIWSFSLFSRAFPNWKDSATLANFP